MRWSAVGLLYLLSSPMLAQSLSGASLGAPTVAGSGTSNISVAFDCRSFGQTVAASELSPGSLNIKYATPVMCWATDTTVQGANVNDTGWVPEVWFDWNWDDNSLGTVTRGGLTVDLGESIGLVAAHAFKPSTYAETCNGGTNSLHTVTLTVHAVVSGTRESDSATLAVCVENPATTWPNPIAYCDDADCSNDSFTNVVNPGTPTHGGNLTALNTILAACASSSNRILLEGGVTFTSGSTNISVSNGQSCLVESYGTGKARLQFTSTSSTNAAINANGTAGYRFNDVEFVGNGTGLRIFTANTDLKGYMAVIDSNASATAGEGFRAMFVNDIGPPTPNGVADELYWFNFQFTKMLNSGLPANFIYGNHVAMVGGEISGVGTAPNANEHNLRMPQWSHVVIDAMKFADQEQGRHLIALRQDCGSSASCPNSPSAQVFAITRNELAASTVGTTPVQICTSGSGATPGEQTKCYDGDILRNVSYWDAAVTSSVDWFYYVDHDDSASGMEVKRVRFMQNACDLTGMDSNASSCFAVRSNILDNVAFFGNVVWHNDTNGQTHQLFSANAADFTSGNNVGFEQGTGSINLFGTETEAATDLSLTSDPFDGASGVPGTFSAFDFTDLKITSGNSSLKGHGEVAAYPTDATDGESIPQSSDYDAGVDDE